MSPQKCPFKAVVGSTTLSVKTDFGAYNLLGNNTEEASNLNAIIDSLSGGETLYFPPGTYLCASQTIMGKAYVNFLGAGMESSWIKGRFRPADHMDFTDIAMGDNSNYAWGGMWTGTYVGNIDCTRVKFNGLLGFSGGPTTAGGLHDATFTDCFYPDSTPWYTGNDGNNVWLYVYGTRADNTYSNITFYGCTFEAPQRIGVEITCYREPAPNLTDFQYPWTGVNLISCDFGPAGGMGASICGRRNGYYIDPDWKTEPLMCGYGTMQDCYFEDGAAGDFQWQCVELGGLRYYTMDSNYVGRIRGSAEATGTHLRTMLGHNADSGPYPGEPNEGWSHKSNDGFDNNQYNTISNNVFDGSASSLSGMAVVGNDHGSFTGNTIITRKENSYQNSQNSEFSGNDVTQLDETTGVGLSTARLAWWFNDCRYITVDDNKFSSKFSSTTLCSIDYQAPTGYCDHIAFDGNEFVKDAGDDMVTYDGGSTNITNTNYTETPA